MSDFRAANEPASATFWVASSSFFESVLLSLSAEPNPTAIRIFDADGGLINELSVEFPSYQVGLIELDPLLEPCKLEAGLKHATVRLQARKPGQFFCRMNAKNGATVVRSAAMLTTATPAFLPITASHDRSAIVSLLNTTEVEAAVRVRLIIGKRSPEILVRIPARGARAVSLYAEFADLLVIDPPESDSIPAKKLQGYVRVTTRDAGQIGVQLLERSACGEKAHLYASVS